MLHNFGRGRVPYQLRQSKASITFDHVVIFAPARIGNPKDTRFACTDMWGHSFVSEDRAKTEIENSFDPRTVVTCDHCEVIKSMALANGMAPLYTRADVHAMFELLGEQP